MLGERGRERKRRREEEEEEEEEMRMDGCQGGSVNHGERESLFSGPFLGFSFLSCSHGWTNYGCLQSRPLPSRGPARRVGCPGCLGDTFNPLQL